MSKRQKLDDGVYEERPCYEAEESKMKFVATIDNQRSQMVQRIIDVVPFINYDIENPNRSLLEYNLGCLIESYLSYELRCIVKPNDDEKNHENRHSEYYYLFNQYDNCPSSCLSITANNTITNVLLLFHTMALLGDGKWYQLKETNFDIETGTSLTQTFNYDRKVVEDMRLHHRSIPLFKSPYNLYVALDVQCSGLCLI